MWKKTQDLSILAPDVPRDQDTTESVIGPSVHLEGNFNSSGNIVIVGSLTGSLITSGDVRIEEGAKVQATVQATNAFIAGELRGDIHANERLELSPTAQVIGNIEAKTLTIAPGAVLHGKCFMKGSGMVKEAAKKQKVGREVKVEEVMAEMEG
ncbi:MAG: polymer-forming cytoskeletal protein [bacterium]|nr:polymer-forming cytoskeletal protein [bacterium]